MNMRSADLINKKFMEYLLPTFLMIVVLSLSFIVDGIIVSILIGPRALAAVNICSPIVLFVNAVNMLVNVGSTTQASIETSKMNRQGAMKIFTLNITTAVIVWVVVAVLCGGLFFNAIVDVLAGGSELREMAAEYFWVHIVFIGFLFITPALVGYIRQDGNPRKAANILIFANILNVILDYVLIKFFDMGVRGAAIATVSSYFIGFLFCIPYLFSKNASYKLIMLKVQDFAKLKDIFGSGMPLSIINILLFAQLVLMNKLALSNFGEAGAVAVAVGNSCFQFAITVVQGSTNVVNPLVSALHGAGDSYGVKRTMKLAISISLAMSALFIALFWLFPHIVCAIFGIQNTGAETIAMTTSNLRIASLYLPIMVINFSLLCLYQATNRKSLAIWTSITQGALVLPIIIIMTEFFGSNGLWSSRMVGQLLAFFIIFMLARYYGKKEGATGLLLYKDSSYDKSLDITINAVVEEVVGLSEKIIEFCADNGISDKVAASIGIAIEEMAVNTAKYGYNNVKNPKIDIRVYINENKVILCFRDSGNLFNPIDYAAENMEENGVTTGGIGLVKLLANDIGYTRTLGFNNLIIKINK